jgi:hypothetical protein
MIFGAFPVLKLLLFCRGDLHREEVKRFNFWNILCRVPLLFTSQGIPFV